MKKSFSFTSRLKHRGSTLIGSPGDHHHLIDSPTSSSSPSSMSPSSTIASLEPIDFSQLFTQYRFPFEDVFDNEECRKQFKDHLIEMSNEESIIFYEVCEEYRRMKSDRNRFYTAIHLIMRFIEPGSDFELNLPQRVRNDCLVQFKQHSNINSCSESLFDKVSSTIFLQMKLDAYPRWNHSSDFKSFITLLIKRDRHVLDTIAVRNQSNKSSSSSNTNHSNHNNTNNNTSDQDDNSNNNNNNNNDNSLSFRPRWMSDIDRMTQNKKQNAANSNNTMTKIRDMFMMHHRQERRPSNPTAPTLAQLNSSLFDDDDDHHKRGRNGGGIGGGIGGEFDSDDEYEDDDDVSVVVIHGASMLSENSCNIGSTSSISGSSNHNSSNSISPMVPAMDKHRSMVVPQLSSPLSSPLSAASSSASPLSSHSNNASPVVGHGAKMNGKNIVHHTYNASYDTVDIWGTLVEEQLREEQENSADGGGSMDHMDDNTGSSSNNYHNNGGGGSGHSNNGGNNTTNSNTSLRRMIKKLGELPNELSLADFNDPYVYGRDFDRVKEDGASLDGWEKLDLGNSTSVPAHLTAYIGNEKFNIVDQESFECIRRFRFSGRLPISARRAVEYFCAPENSIKLDPTLTSAPTFLVMVKNLDGETGHSSSNHSQDSRTHGSPRLTPRDFSHAYAGFISHHTHKYSWPIKNRSFLTVQSVIYEEPSDDEEDNAGQYLIYKKSVNIEDAVISSVEKLRGHMTESVIFKQEAKGCSFTVITWYDMKKQFSNSTFQKIMKKSAISFAEPASWVEWDQRQPISKRVSTILSSKPTLYDTLEYYLLVKELSTKESVQKKIRRTMKTLNTLVNFELNPYAAVETISKYNNQQEATD